MSSIGLDPVESADFADHVARNPGQPGPPDWLTGSTALAPFAGIEQGSAQLTLAGEEAVAPVLRVYTKAFDDQYGTSSTAWLDDVQQRARAHIDAQAEISPSVYGKAGEIIGGLTRFGTEAVVGGALAGPVGMIAATGAGEGFTKYRKLIAQGVDPDTAAQLAGIEGAVAGASSVLPLTGKTLAQSMVRGAAIFPYLNAWQRGVTHQVLDNAGYHDMAQQYQMLDGRALVTDGVMGALFGGLAHAGHASASADANIGIADAALTDATGRHIESAGPGIPADPYTRNANVAALVKGTEDLLAGDPVDVSRAIDPERAAFVSDPATAYYNNVWRDAVEEEHGPAIAEAQRMQNEAGFGAAEDSPIAAAVVRFGGKEFDAPTHIAAIKQAQAEGLLPRNEAGKITLGENDSINLFRLKDGSLVTRDEAAALGNAKRTEQLPTLTGGASLDSIRSEIGWAERGGGLIRDTNYTSSDLAADGSPLQGAGAVTGRTKWIAKSDFWPGRPDKSLSETGAQAALDKVTAGERLTPREQRFVDYSRRTLQDRGAVEDALRLESKQERTAIQAESGVTDADLIDAGYLDVSPGQRIAVERMAAYADQLEAARNEIERLNADDRAEIHGRNRAPDAGRTDAGARPPAQGERTAQGAGGGERRAAPGEAQAQGQDALAPARQIAAEHPDMQVTLDDGITVPIADAIARSDADTARADEAARLTQVAVDCALRSAA